MLRLVDPTNVADAASAGERTCVERISPVEGEGLEPSVPHKSDDGFEPAPFNRSGTFPFREGPTIRIPLPPPARLSQQ